MITIATLMIMSLLVLIVQLLIWYYNGYDTWDKLNHYLNTEPDTEILGTLLIIPALILIFCSLILVYNGIYDILEFMF